MPIYEYKCKSCGKITEIWHGVNESPNNRCLHCGGDLQKVISNSGFILKGSGWYVTDYKRRNNNPKSDKPKKVEKEKGEKSPAPPAPSESPKKSDDREE